MRAGSVTVKIQDKGAAIEEIDFAKIPLAEAFKILEVRMSHVGDSNL